MILVKPSFEILDNLRLGLIEHVELCGRTCYKSEDRITPGSAEKFVGNIIKRGHESVLEHGNIIMDVPPAIYNTLRLFDLRHINFTNIYNNRISGNVRAFRDLAKVFGNTREVKRIMGTLANTYPTLFNEFPWISDNKIKLLTEKDLSLDLDKVEVKTHGTRSVKIVCDRGVSHELVRHRKASFSQESTRYCDYNKSGDLTFVIPSWITTIGPGHVTMDNLCGLPDVDFEWANMMWCCECSYKALRKMGWEPQQARSVLPNSLKTEIVVTMTHRWWHHFFGLRTDKAAHPQMRESAIPVLRTFQQENPGIYDDITVEE